jgi:hypothetical protein
MEEEGRPGPLHDAIGDLGDLELRANRLVYVHELFLFA